jgi:hypothetical protein
LAVSIAVASIRLPYGCGRFEGMQTFTLVVWLAVAPWPGQRRRFPSRRAWVLRVGLTAPGERVTLREQQFQTLSQLKPMRA